MTFYGQDFENAIRVYKIEVRAGERRALRLARVAPRAKDGGGWVRKAAEWLGKQWANLGRDQVPGMRVAHGEQA